MADFDKDLRPIIKPTGYQASNIPLGPAMNFSADGGGGVSDLSQEEDIFSELAAAGQKFSQKGLFITNAELEANKRYKTFNPTIGDYEDFAAQGQEWYKQATNGVLKGANLTATTLAGGFGMLYGVGKAALFTHKLSDVWDNEVMRGLDKWNEKVDNEYLPNYYTAAERNAEWYSTDNWFTTNFLFDKLVKNSGYAVGAMLSGNIANAGLLRAGSMLGNLAAKGATAAQASQSFKLFTPLLRNTARAFSAGKNLEAASLLESQISSIADLSARSSQLANIAKQTSQFAKFSDTARRTAVATYSSAGEASFEALQTAKEYRENMIEDFTRKNGYEPTGEELKNIELQAEKVGKTSFFGNLALLSITEFNQLPYLIGSKYEPSRQAINSLLGKVDNAAVDAALKGTPKVAPKTRFGKLYEGVKKAGVYVYDPKESAQEILQYGLQVGTQNYFKKAEQGGEADIFVDGFLYGLFGKDKLGEGVGALVSKEGVEGGVLGGITGGLMQARGNYQERKAVAKNTQSFLNMLDNSPTFKEAFQERLAAANRGVVLQQQHRDAIINGDRLEERELFNDQMHNYLSPRIKYGRFDMVMEDLGELKRGGMTEQGLSELKEQGMANINDTVESFQKRITSIENSAKSLNDIYQSLNIRYAGETVEIDGQEVRKYPSPVIDMLAYAGTKIANYDVRIPELNGKLVTAGINTQAILNDIIATGIPNAEATREALDTINAMSVTSDVKDELKGQLDDVIELSLRRKMFIEEYDGIKNNPLNYIRPEQEVDEVDVLQKEGRKKVEKTLEVGKTYSLAEPITLERGKLVLAPKFTVLSSTLGGEFEVQLPDGTTTFFSPEQFNKYNITEEDNTSQEMEDALNQAIDDVLNYPAFKNVVEKPGEGVNKLEYVNSLGDQKLIKAIVNRFNKLTKEIFEAKAQAKAVADKIKESKAQLDKQQQELSDENDANSVIVPEMNDTTGEERISTGETGPLKSASIFFDSTTTDSEDPKRNTKIAESPAHIRRSRIFLNNARKMKNRNNLRAMVFTYNQEQSLGLSGITALSYKTTQEEIDADPEAFKTKVNNVDNGFVAVVFVELDGNKKYFIDENGKRIAEVNGQPVDLGKVVFQTMPTTSVEDSKGKDRYREEEEEEFKQLAQVWRSKRNILINGTATPIYEFNVSKGFPVTQKEDNGLFKKNPVTQAIIDDKTLLTTAGVINVAVTNTVTHNGKIISAKKGHVYIQDGEIIQYLNNNKLGQEKATTIYQLINSIVNKLQKDAAEGKTPKFDENKILFIKNVLNYKKPVGEMKENQIWFDTDQLIVKIGKESYKFDQIASLEKDIIDQLSDVYHSANSKTLKESVTKKFFEYFYKDGKLQEREWPNYQTYLASGKDSTGKTARPTDQVPFVTIASPTAAQPYPFAGKYATLINFEVEGQQQVVPTEKKEVPKPSQRKSQANPSDVIVPDAAVTAGPYELNSGKENTIEYKAGIFRFKANLLPDGNVEIDSISEEVNKATYVALSKNEKIINKTREIFPELSKDANDEQVAKLFFIWDAGNKVEKALKEQAPAPAPPAPEAPVSDVGKTLSEQKLREILDFDLYSRMYGAVEFLKNPRAKILSRIKDYEDSGHPTSSSETKKALYNEALRDLQKYDAERRKQETIASIKEGYNGGKTWNYTGQFNNQVTKFTDYEVFQNEYSKEELIKEINAKYDAELAALEGKPVEEPKPSVEKTTLPGEEADLDFDSGVDEGAPFRRIGEAEKGERIDDRDIRIFKEWAKEKVPTIPFEILDNIISINKTEKAWGVFENGVAKFFKRGLRGTEYHEIGEAIWNAFLSPQERQALIEEFKSKKGDFVDRESGKFIAHSQATDTQAKERILDDLAEFRVGKLPARSLSERVRRFFKAIVDFFKSFVTKPSLKKQLFEAIEAGKFKDYTISDAVKSADPQYRKIQLPQGGYLSEDVAWALVQDMTLTMADFIFNRDTDGGLEKLYYPGKVTGKEVYNYLRSRYEANIAKLGEEGFQELFFRSKDLIRTLGAELDTEGISTKNDNDQSNRLYAAEAFEVDFKKNMKFAVKFLLATSPATKANYNYKEGAPEFLTYTNSKGKQTKLKVLNNYNKLFAILLNELSNTSLKKVDEKFIQLVQNNGNYYKILTRLRGNAKDGTIDFSKFDKNDLRFYIQFVQSFMKSNPFVEVAVARRADKNTESFTIPGDRTSALYKTRSEWFQNIKKLSKSETSFIKKEVVVNREGRKVQYVIDEKQQYYPQRSAFVKPEVVSSYLKNIGIEFPATFIEKINADKKLNKKFNDAVKGIYEFGPKGYAFLSGEKFGEVDSHVTTLADLYVRSVNPDQDTTRFNIKNKRTGNFSDSNAPSVFEAEFNEAMTFEELLQSRPELADAFAKNSLILKRDVDGMFFDEEGNKKPGNKLRIGVIDGLKDEIADQGVSISELTKGQRFTVEMNQNINGRYYILVPADSSTERMIDFGTFVDYDLFNEEGDRAYNQIYKIFEGYFEDEVDLALDWENRSKLAATKNNAKELRFFKDILDPEMVEEIHRMIAAGESKEDIINYATEKNKSKFQESIKNTIAELNARNLQDLKDGGEVFDINLEANETGYQYPLLDSKFAEKYNLDKSVLTEREMNQILSFINVNYTIANIEMHKFIFGDPYQFKIKNGKLDETKRIKSWLSPRRITIDRPEINSRLNDLYNDITPDISLEPDDITRHEFKEYAKTVTVADVNPVSILSDFGRDKDYDEADGFSIMTDGTYREVKLKNGEWSEDLAEPWFQWNRAYARQKMAARGKYGYKSEALRKHDADLIKTPQPPYVAEVLKPIVSGVKNKLTRIEAVIDKMSQMPITYKMVEGTNLENLYIQMLENQIGYVAFASARKEGTRSTHQLYNGDGTFNSKEFGELTIENIAWKTYGIQVENSYEEGKRQTRISQLTKNDTMDMFQNGKEEKGFKGAAKLADDKVKVFNEMHQNAFQKFLNKLGLEDLGADGYNLADPVMVARELERELMKRQMSQNVIDTIRLNDDGEFTIPFEASSAYEQIRSVLVSMINKSLLSPSMSGKPHVQAPATLWESGEGRKLVRKVGNKYVEITREQYNALSDKDKSTVRLASDTLKFYENKDGQRYMEVMIPNYWKKYFKGMTDEEALAYLNRPENQKILFGVGARIPHQAMSSTEVFKVKGFLDPSMGSTVVVPSEIVAKAGSDFDIDKLNMYLKSVYVDASGNVKLVEYKGSKEATIEFYKKVYEDYVQNELENIPSGDEFRDDLLSFFDQYETIENFDEVDPFDLKNMLGEDQFSFYARYSKTIKNIIAQADREEIKPSEYIVNQMGRLANKYEKLSTKSIVENLKTQYAEDMYARSLENRYYEILESMITLPGNFERLMSPVGDAGLSKVAEILDEATGENEANVKNKLISRSFMTSLRHAFVMAKKWVGIAAVNITGHSIGQKVGLYFDHNLLNRLSDYDKEFLNDLNLKVPHNTVEVNGRSMISLGGRLSADGRNEFISDRLSGYATAFVDVAKDPYILKILQSDVVVGTGMLMERIGVGELTPYFLRQPIIVEYLKMLDRKKSRSLFGKENRTDLLDMFPVKGKGTYDLSVDFVKNEDGTVNFEKSRESLLDSIRTYSADKKAAVSSDQFNLKQRAVFNEFLALAKLAQLNFKFSQSYNFDTTRVRNYEGFKRKLTRTFQSNETNIISSVGKVLNGTFIGEQARLIREELKALGAIMKLDNQDIEIYIDTVMEPFYNDEFISSDDFDYISKKLKSSFLDFVIQSRSDLIVPADYKNLFVGEKSVASRLLKMKEQERYPSILNYLVPFSSLQENGPVTVALKVKPEDAIDINRHIGMMLELKEQEPQFYNDLVKLSVLQGTFETNLSIASIIPVEDRAAYIAPIINTLKPSEQLETFHREGLFYRNNFTDDRMVPEIRPRYRDGMDDYAELVNIDYRRVSTFFMLPSIGLLPANPQLIKLNNKYSFMNQANSDFVKMKRYQFVSAGIETKVIDLIGGKQMDVSDFKKLSNEGSISPSQLIGYKRVKSADNVPLTYQQPSKDGFDEYSVFKMVNLYGNARIVAEYPKVMGPSAFENNTVKVDKELSDQEVIDLLSGVPVEAPKKTTIAPQNTTSSQIKQEPSSQTSLPKETLKTPVATIPQNKVSGVESYGSKVTAAPNVIQALGQNPHSIDMIISGFRTRTTRSSDEMDKYMVKVGDIVKHFGKSADGTTKEVLARVTAIHPKGSAGWKGTWSKEGWRKEDVDVIDRFKDGAAAIEFELINPVAQAPISQAPAPQQPSSTAREYTPENITSLKPNEVFVFGSNDRGNHGAGAAKTAVDKFGAIYKQASGRQGQSFAVRTKMYQDGNLLEYNKLTEENKKNMDSMTVQDLNNLRLEALANPGTKYYVTQIGTKLAGRTVEQMKSFFERMNSKFGIPDNLILPKEFEVRGMKQPTSKPSQTTAPQEPQEPGSATSDENKIVKKYFEDTNDEYFGKFVQSFEPGDYEFLSVDGVKHLINTRSINDINPKSGYSTVYGSYINETRVLNAFYGKRLIIPGYEDIQIFRRQGDTSGVLEGSTGKLINFKDDLKLSSPDKDYIDALKKFFDSRTDIREVINTTPKITINRPDAVITPIDDSSEVSGARTIQVDQYKISVLPDGRMFFTNGKEVTDQTIKNKVDIKKEYQDKTLRISTYNKSEYFVLSDGRILGSGKTNLGKETVTDPDIKKNILMKAILYKKTC